MSDTPQPDTPEAALARIGDLKRDESWMRSLADGDRGKLSEFTRLHEVAYGNAPYDATEGGVQTFGQTATSGRAAPTPGTQPVTEDGVLHPGMPGYDEANAQIFGPPAGPWAYDFPAFEGMQESAQDFQLISGVRQAFFDEGIPSFFVSQVHEVINRNMKNGPPDTAATERLRQSGLAELHRRHGASAQALIADAKKLFDRLDARNPHIGDMLGNSGAANDPGLIETLARLQRDVYAKRRS